MQTQLLKNIAISLYIVILGLGNVCAQGDILKNSSPQSFYTNSVKKYSQNSSTKKYENVYTKKVGNLICFNVPKSIRGDEIAEYLENYYYDSKKSAQANAEDALFADSGRDIIKRPIKTLRLNNYRNTQNSLELNTSSMSAGEAELESGETCTIYNNIEYNYWGTEKNLK